jgi:CheY-like chemotaxis protein
MSHEIRTPINAILGMNEMILRESNENNVLSYAGNVKTAGQTLLGIVNDILDFSRIESGKLTIVPVEYDLSVVLNDLVNMVKTRAEEKDLTLYTDFDENIPKYLYGDEIRIKQAITNILTNAVKYTEKGSVTFRVAFNRVTDEPDQIVLYVSVKDSGIGIKEEDLQKIFSEFERLELQRNRSIEGTGLGMNITKHILDLMGSTLQVESIYGFGSTFSFSLKQKVMKWDPLGDYRISVEKPAEEQTRYRAKFSAPDARVLVVDDNPMNLMVFKSLLSKTKLKIDTAGSGDEALHLTANAPYDMIFLDHMMPDKDGIETLHEIKQQADNPNRNTPYVCLTANAISGAREQYLAEGFDDYLSKPINPEKLEEMLIKHLPEDKLEEADAEEELQPEEEFPEELAPIRDFPLIDIDEGIKNSGSVTAYLSLLKIFFNSIDDTSLALEKYNADEDYHNFTIRIHALKSSARIIGATELGEDAQLLENAGKSGDTDYIHSHFGSFLEKYRSLRDPLEKAFPETEPEDKPEASGDDIKRCLEEIKAAANDMDCDRLEKIFEEMDSWRIPDEYAKLWNKLKEASDQFDYDKILELLNE